MTATELDLATLLLKDRILIHNLLVDDAREFTMDAYDKIQKEQKQS